VDHMGKAGRPHARQQVSKLDKLYERFPALGQHNHRVTSIHNDTYNCVAWVRQEMNEWWEPGFCWPDDLVVSDDEGDLDAYIELFGRWGYDRCPDCEYEPGYLKISLYAQDGEFFHVAKQLRDGTWSSKAGSLHDLKHCNLAALEGSWALQFASPTVFMRRADDDDDPMTLEHGRLLLP
jgi:hypothetical protein